jgi:site-specific DNA-methyltransferase (adenine-specific)
MELNRVYHKDCRGYMESLPDSCVNLIIADPPYGISKQKTFSDSSHGMIRGLSETWDTFENEKAYCDFTKSWISHVKRILTENGSIVVWGNNISIFKVQKYLEETGMYYRGLITWIKRDSPPNVTRRSYALSAEYAVWFCKSKTGWIFNHDDLRRLNGGKQMRDFWDIPKTMTKQEYTKHRTQKKYETAERLVVGHSRKGDTVYIPFAGSGTEIEACIKNGRNWLATETENQYIKQFILPRIQSFTQT